MMIFNELEFAKKIDEDSNKVTFTIKELILLAKYYKYNGFDYDYIKNKLYYKLNGNNLNKMNVALSVYEKNKLKIPNNIIIFKEELDFIQNELNFEYQKILFIMLCLVKFFGGGQKDTLATKAGTETTFSKIIRLANAKLSKEEKGMLPYYLSQKEYIQMFLPNVSKILFVQKEGTVILEFVPSENMILQFEKYCGKRILVCERCGRLCRKKCNVQKYCNECSIIVKSEKDAERHKK